MKIKILLLILITFTLSGCIDEHWSQDTYASFSNGKYQILRYHPDFVLRNMNDNQILESYVYGYGKKGDKVYVYGRDSYTILDLKKDKIIQCRYGGLHEYQEKIIKNKNYEAVNVFGDFDKVDQSNFDEIVKNPQLRKPKE